MKSYQNVTWMLSAGHGGINPDTLKYVTAPSKMYEYEDFTIYEGVFNRQIRSLIWNRLIGNDHKRAMVNIGYQDMSLGAKIKSVNNYQAIHGDCILLELHGNAGKGTGFEVYTSEGETISDTIANLWVAEFESEFTNEVSRGEKDRDFSMVANTNCPAILNECWLMDKSKEGFVRHFLNKQIMTKERKIYLSIIGLLLVVIVFLQECGGSGELDHVHTLDTIPTVIYDSTETIVYRDTGSFHIETIYKAVPSKVDTGAILAAYFAVNVVYDTIFKDSNYRATITDTVTQNAIVGRSVSFKNLRPKKVFTVVNTAVYDTCPEPKAKIYLGAMLGGNITQFDFGPKATFITRRDHLYEFKYEVISETFWVGTEFKIHFRNIFRRRKK